MASFLKASLSSVGAGPLSQGCGSSGARWHAKVVWMKYLMLPARYGYFLLCASLLLVLAGPAKAEPAVSGWSQGAKSAIRLLSGGPGASDTLRAGLEFSLAKGYKTYWRSPGDSGIPPRFDWSGSENVAGITVNWPAPVRFGDESNSSIGYIADVILPLSVRPANPAKPVRLVLRLEYAVCEKMCIPVAGEASLTLAPEPTVETARILASKEHVPASTEKHRDKAPSIADTTILHGPAGQATLQFTVTVPEAGRIDDIFIEGPDMWSFGKPEFKPAGDGRMVATVEVTDRPKSVAGPIPVVVTITGTPFAMEAHLEVDMTRQRP